LQPCGSASHAAVRLAWRSFYGTGMTDDVTAMQQNSVPAVRWPHSADAQQAHHPGETRECLLAYGLNLPRVSLRINLHVPFTGLSEDSLALTRLHRVGVSACWRTGVMVLSTELCDLLMQLQLKNSRREVANLLRTNKAENARIRVEAVMREETMLQAYDG